MTKDQITRLAKEAGIRDCTCNGELGCLERFATLIAEREWVGLTDEDLKLLSAEWRIVYGAWMDDFARDIEAKLKGKNI